MMMQSRANPPPPFTRASAVHRRRRHPISNTRNIITFRRKAFRKKKSAVIPRGGFLEDAMEFAKQKSSEVEETIKSAVTTSRSSSSNKRLNVEELKEALLSKIATCTGAPHARARLENNCNLYCTGISEIFICDLYVDDTSET